MENDFEKAVKILTGQGKFHICLGLERVSKVLGLLNNPQDKLRIVHIAGTNGKGSTCAMLSEIFTKSGLKTGLYTSPHLVNYTERIKINGIDISKKDFSDFLFKILETADKNGIHLTEFEILTVIAFCYFEKQKVDVVLLETGLGGRLDATNVTKKPLVTIISSIDMDHTDRLGNTIEKIAAEKAGIIKQNSPVVVSKENKGFEVVKQTAQAKHAPLFCADNYSNIDFDGAKNLITIKNKTYELNLLGLWQGENLALVVKAIEILNANGFKISEKAVDEGLKTVAWPARMQFFKDKNLIIDGAHNPSGATTLKQSLDKYFPDKKRVWLYACINTKDYAQIIDILFDKDDTVIFSGFQYPSSVDPENLKLQMLKTNPCQKTFVNKNLNDSVNLLLKQKANNNILVIAGSLYMAGSVLASKIL